MAAGAGAVVVLLAVRAAEPDRVGDEVELHRRRRAGRQGRAGAVDVEPDRIGEVVAGAQRPAVPGGLEPVAAQPQDNSHRFHVKLEGTQVVSNIGDLAINQWRKYGPYPVTVSDGVLTMDLVGAYGKPMLSGFTLTKL